MTHKFQENGQICDTENGVVSSSIYANEVVCSGILEEVSSTNEKIFESNDEGLKTPDEESQSRCPVLDTSDEKGKTGVTVINSSPSIHEKDINMSPSIIVRQVLHSDGVYIEGQGQGHEICFTVDTGATRTVLSSQVFQQIPVAHRPILKSSNTLASADGKPLQKLGKAIFVIK